MSGTEYCLPIIPAEIPYPSYGIEWGNLWSEISPDPDLGIAIIASGGGGRVLALETPEYFKFNILEVRADQTRTQLFSMDGWSGSGLVADAAGRIFVLAAHPSDGSSRIFVLSADGSHLATYPVSGSTEGFYQRIDLASDQCTLYFRVNEGQVRRFDVCTGAPLADFAVDGFNAAVLPDGDILVSQSNHLFRYDQSGMLVRTYAFGTLHIGPGIAAFALAAGGKRALVQMGCDFESQIREVDLDSGVVTVRPEPLTAVRGEVTAIVPTNGWTAALGSAAAVATADVPMIGTSSILALAAILALLGLSRLR